MKSLGQMLCAVTLAAVLTVTGCAADPARPSASDPPSSASSPGTPTEPSSAPTEPAGAYLSFTPENYPKVDGSTATIPLSEAFMATLTGKTVEDIRFHIKHSKTHGAYVNLINGDRDIIFVTYPSEEEQEFAKSNRVELEIVPIVREGFVFLTDRDNPVTSLTQRQIVDIYTGRVTDWSEVGGPAQPIFAYQRPPNSGSQSGFLRLVMRDERPVEPPIEYVVGAMGGLIDTVASFDASERGAIGYSYYYYATDMRQNDHIRLLAVDGILPEPKSIADGSYPYHTAYYAVLRKDTPADHPARRLLEWILSEEGQTVAKNAGYVKLVE